MENKSDDVIYISSDDDEDTGQSNTVNKQESVIKQQKDNCDFQIKVETSPSDSEMLKLCGQKRKIAEINSEGDSYSRKKANILTCQGNSNAKMCNIEKKEEKKVEKEEKKVEKEEEKKEGKVNGKKEEQKDEKKEEKECENEKKEDKTLLKPKLIVKEKKTIFPVEQDIFPMFISLCLQKDHSEDMKAIVNKLKRRYEQLDTKYANSEIFINFLNAKRNDIMNSKNKLYTHIAEVMNEMKNSCKGKSTLLLNDSSGVRKSNKNSDSNVSNVSYSKTSHLSASVVNENEKLATNTDNEEDEEKQRALQRKLKTIVKTMKSCEKCIKELEEAEVDFDDENNSNYMKLEKYKQRMVELYNKYCEYTGENADAGRQYLRPKHFSTTGIVSVDHAITNFINSKISKRHKLSKKIGGFTDALIFPDYTDILKCVTKCNELHNLDLNTKKQQQIAKKAFTELGEYLQRCRRNDYWDTFSTFLENKEDDPASKDPMLAEKLVKNKVEGEKRLSNIFQEYVKKQEEMKDRITDSKTSSENEEDEEDSVENDNEDDNEDDNEVDDFSETDIDKDNVKSDEDGNSTDDGETLKDETTTKTKSNTEISSDIIEIDKMQQTEINDRLKANNDDDLKLEKIDSTENTSNCTTNLEAKSMKENDATSSLQQLSTLPSVMLSNVIDNKLPTNKAKEDLPNIMDEDPMDDKPLEEKAEEGKNNDDAEKELEGEEEKPLLRVRSFAKPPTTWKDVQEKVDGYNDNANLSKTLTDKDVIDLTEDSPKENSTIRQCTAIQIGSIVKGNYKTLLIPAGKSIINVKNITNNYVRLNTENRDSNNVSKLESDQIISPQRVIAKATKSAIIHLSPSSPANQKLNTNNQAHYSQTKQKDKVEQTSQPNKIIMLPIIQAGSTSQRPKTNSSTTKSK